MAHVHQSSGWSSKHAFLTQIIRNSYYVLDFDQKSKIKPQEYSKFVANKKALMTIISGQWGKATETKIALGENYNVDCQTGNLIEFLKRVHTVCLEATTEAYPLDPINK